MERVATRRLIDAAASLDAADRALVNLWANRGLDDAAVARMTGTDPSAIAERRGRIVTRLATELGLPPDQVAETLERLAAAVDPPVGTGAGAHPDTEPSETSPDDGAVDNLAAPGGRADEATGDGAAEVEPSPDHDEVPGEPVDASANGHAPTPESVIATAEIPVPATTADDAPTTADDAPTTADDAPTTADDAPTTADDAAGADTTSDSTRRRRWAWIPLLLAAALVVAVVVIVAGGSSPKPHRTVAAVVTHTAPPAPVTPTVPSPSQTVPSPSPTVSRPPADPLAALPGGVSRARGAVFLSGRRHHLKLRLTVTGLPAARGGHYEVWLYNTVVDSQPLARLRSGVRQLLIKLPSHAARFQWIDISFQPAGVIYHSGESILRASDPARTSPRKLRRRSARRRQLRRAIKGSRRARKSK